MSKDSVYSDFIYQLPLIQAAFPGVEGHLLEGPNGQVVFFRLPAGTEVPLHSHGAQWGIVVRGQLDLNIGGVTRTYRPGDTYQIGDGEEHGASIKEEVWVIDVFAENDRYQPRED